MNSDPHVDLPQHLPFFITPPGQIDVLMYVALGVLIVAVFLIGVFYLKLHAIPEQLAHRGQKIQFQIVAVLALLALFTHIHLFWIVALLLALVELPDFSTPVQSMARSLETLAQRGAAIVPSTRDGSPPADDASHGGGERMGSDHFSPRDTAPLPDATNIAAKE